MAEKEVKTGKKVGEDISGTALLALGLIGLGGIGLWKLSDWLMAREVIKRELFNEYYIELHDLEEFQAALADKGELDESDHSMLDTKIQAMRVKELVIRDYSTGWIGDLRNGIVDFLKTLGIYVIPTAIAGYLIIQIIRHLFRKRPPRPPTFQCPYDGLIFADEKALKAHIEREHSANPNPQAILSAQAIYARQPFWVQEVIAAESGLYDKAQRNWTTLRPQEQLSLAYGMSFMVAIGIAVEVLGPAAVLLLIPLAI